MGPNSPMVVYVDPLGFLSISAAVPWSLLQPVPERQRAGSRCSHSRRRPGSICFGKLKKVAARFADVFQ